MEKKNKTLVIFGALIAVIVAGAAFWLTNSFKAQNADAPTSVDIVPPPVSTTDDDHDVSDIILIEPASGGDGTETSTTDGSGSYWYGNGNIGNSPGWGGTDRGNTGLGIGNSGTVVGKFNGGTTTNSPGYNLPPNTFPQVNCTNSPHLAGCENDPQLLRNLQMSSLGELATLYRDAPSNIRKAILEEVESREQRVTSVTGEFFPDMQHNKEHNAFITVTRGLIGETSVAPSQTAEGLMRQTAEPETIDVPDTRTTPEVGIKLSGAGFTIEPEGFVWRTIPDGEEDTFEWTVRPDDENASQLLVSVRNKVVFGDQEISLKVDEFPKSITVTVDFWTRAGRVMSAIGEFAKSTQGLLSLLGVGSVGAILAWFRRKGKKGQLGANKTANGPVKRSPPPGGMGGPPTTG
ncbi:MAG: hypothetical protein K5905_01295 [Roseibium sp.]|uniref:hypothetical protein n=1 Tax=Roseibium sp. TaxID=1936156 RepID=UPI002630A214|nr:hypothetical protein [Roseibium sp.]MCV0424084.1 hypothetical protein [Roseibium sp.]